MPSEDFAADERSKFQKMAARDGEDAWLQGDSGASGRRLFHKAVNSPTPSPKFSITDAGAFLHAVADAAEHHRTVRFGAEGAILSEGTEGGSHFKVVPAGSQDELEAQIAKLTLAFQEAEGRGPNPDDDFFWIAVNELRAAFDGPELGSSDDVMSGLS